jgi:hypothetical protein
MPSLSKDLFREPPARSPIIDGGNYPPEFNGVISEIEEGLTEIEWTSRARADPSSKRSTTSWPTASSTVAFRRVRRAALRSPVSGESD